MKFEIHSGAIWRYLKDGTCAKVADIVDPGDAKRLVIQANSMDKVNEIVDGQMFALYTKENKGDAE